MKSAEILDFGIKNGFNFDNLALAGNGNGFLELGVEQIKTFYRLTGFFNECLVFFS